MARSGVVRESFGIKSSVIHAPSLVLPAFLETAIAPTLTKMACFEYYRLRDAKNSTPQTLPLSDLLPR
ncbi:hypothetical protein LC613_41820 [Nostoc sphaeroides CHAB 2801]|uniref:hypothetical protein n=1 Tax=Nostoc sphaeroides TaxID=446679 RepID=UPI001E2878E1|nr:hypothetical protein [Nostoc sphaeroides]MCC5633950.1 hypothetical protein [Nostoc sphaeroides CHAB 2801]